MTPGADRGPVDSGRTVVQKSTRAPSGLPFEHARVKRLRRLIGRRSARFDERAFVVEGAKVLGEAFDAGARIEALFVAPGTTHPVIDQALAAGVRVYDLAPGVLERVADTVTPQPILAVVAMESATMEVLQAPLASGGFVVVGVDLRDPGNAGTVIRSAESSGAAGIVLCEGCVEPTNPKTVRASAGALFHLPVIPGPSPDETLEMLRVWGVRSWAASARRGEAQSYDLADLTGPCAIVIGNEAHGLPVEIEASATGLITIPMPGRTESLNVGMATAILCFEAARQRRIVSAR